MNVSILIIKTIVLFCLSYLLVWQNDIASQPRKIKVLQHDNLKKLVIEENEIEFDLTLPIYNGSYSENDLEEAIQFLKIPTYSKGYINCDKPGSEVSCFEIIRATNKIREYESLYYKNKLRGYVYVDLHEYQLEDKMSMIYHAMCISMATKRKIGLNKDLIPFDLPDFIEDIKTIPSDSKVLPNDHQFACADIGYAHMNLLLNNFSWPQVLYTHHVVGPFLRNHFSFHAAYFIGNFLFGTKEIEEKCKSKYNIALEVSQIYARNTLLTDRYPDIIYEEGFKEDLDIVTRLNDSEFHTNVASNVYKMSDDNSLICGLNILMSSKRIVHTFGSRFGFWAQAMKGSYGAYVNAIDHIVTNLTHSQTGSIWHTYCQDVDNVLKVNDKMFICGPNVNDVRYYIEYLLW